MFYAQEQFLQSTAQQDKSISLSFKSVRRTVKRHLCNNAIVCIKRMQEEDYRKYRCPYIPRIHSRGCPKTIWYVKGFTRTVYTIRIKRGEKSLTPLAPILDTEPGAECGDDIYIVINTDITRRRKHLHDKIYPFPAIRLASIGAEGRLLLGRRSPTFDANVAYYQ